LRVQGFRGMYYIFLNSKMFFFFSTSSAQE
jgi:hypothetical protein